MDDKTDQSNLGRKRATRLAKERKVRAARKVAILVAGMHRSGTSAFARTFNLLGCDLPKTLMPPGLGNEAGHWESEAVAGLNDEILASAGLAWDDWEAINPSWYSSPIKDGFLERARDTLRNEFSTSRLFVLKDPRICRLLPFWIEALAAFGAEPLIVSPVRNPLEVAASLHERERMDPSVAQLLWLRHVLDVEAHSRDLKRVYIRYDELLSRWQAVARQLSDDWKLTWPRQSTRADLEIESFLAQEHRHHVADDRRVIDNPRLSHWIRSSFDIFNRWSAGEVREGDKAELDRIRAAFDEAAPAFARSVAIGRQAARRNTALESELVAVRERSLQLDHSVATRDAELAQSRKLFGELESALTARDAELALGKAQLSELEDALTARDAELASSKAQLGELEGALAGHAARLQDRKSRIEELEAAAAARQADLETSIARSKELERAVATFEVEIAKYKDCVRSIEENLTSRETALQVSAGRIAALQAVTAERDAALLASTQRVSELEAALAERNGDLKASAARIGQLEQMVMSHLSELVASKGRLDELASEVETLDAKLGKSRARIEELRRSADARRIEHNAEVAAHNRTVVEKNREIAGLQNVAAEREARAAKLQVVISALRASTSWRITAPLRGAKRVAGRLRYSAVGIPLLLSWRAFWTMSRAPLRDLAAVNAIAGSDLFDRDWYCKRYPDVAEWGIDPVRHYVAFGAREGRDPGPDFQTASYLEQNPDVAVAGVNPLGHYLRFGQEEGRAIVKPASPLSEYEKWIELYDTLMPAQRERMHADIADLKQPPTISVVMPVFNTDPKWLAAAIASVKRQVYPHWELCISDDASTLAGVRDLLQQAARDDQRIKLHFRDERGHISVNTNSALALASGDFIALLDADDELPESALYWVAREIGLHPDVDMLFSDEDKIDERGRRFDPYFKTDWNPALMLSQNAFCHLGVYRRSLVDAVGGLREGYEGSQDHDLVLRAADATSPGRIRHISRVLYHWRVLPESTASGSSAKPYAWEAGRRAICDHLARQNIAGRVRKQLGHLYQVEYDEPAHWPEVAIIWPSTLKADVSQRCLRLLLEKTTYKNFSILVTLHASDAALISENSAMTDLLRDSRVQVVAYDHKPFNYSWVNNFAVSKTNAGYICFLNDDVEVITGDWLEQLVVRSMQSGVGAAGAMLYYPNETIQHAGVIIGVGGVADHAFRRRKRGSDGYFGRAGLEQDLSCITAACMVIRREAFEQAGRFDEGLPCAFNDVDLCLTLRRDGWRIVWTPAAEAYHHESMTLGRHSHPDRADQFRQDVQLMRQRYSDVLDADPYYSPNLSLDPSKQFGLAFPPRVGTRGYEEAIDVHEQKVPTDSPPNGADVGQKGTFTGC
ncbi:MAG: glycosyltransferase [Xanthobacteraceae bacterium]